MTNEKANALDLISVINFCASEDAISKVKKQLKKWEEICHTSPKGLVSRKYKGLLQISYEEAMTVDWNKQFSKEKYSNGQQACDAQHHWLLGKHKSISH